ncbi:MAG: excinuclease ABC subunit UvrA [Patescibacteria group bacterium]|nr:excinuclease ABC subunit UvrA [Patescibacteria group bacterium]
MQKLTVRGAREHNLQNIDLEIPRDKLVVFTGLSGSGKSSLAFDTIYAEGQRRYVESLSAYARQFLGLMEKPDVDQIDGLSPAISIDQKSASRNPRSTVGTVTEVYDYLRLIFSRVGTPHCPIGGAEVRRQTPTEVEDQIRKLPAGTKVMLLGPVVIDRKGEHEKVFEKLQKGGFSRVRVDGTVRELSDDIPKLDKKRKHTIEAVVDRLIIKPDLGNRLFDSVQTALGVGEGTMFIETVEGAKKKPTRWRFSEDYACPNGHPSLPPLEPRSFSFNSPHGACPRCTGLGSRLEVDPKKCIPNPRLTLAEGAIRPWSRTTSRMTWYSRLLEGLAEALDFSVDKPVGALPPAVIKAIFHGIEGEITVRQGSRTFKTVYEGVSPNLERRHRETESDYVRKEIEKYMTLKPCPMCQGKRLRPEILGVTIGDKSIVDVSEMPVDEAQQFFATLQLTDKQKQIAKQICKELRERLKFLENVGLSYLTLSRAANTLSGGEAQRIRLATQIGSALMGVLYILDEPSIGLHQRDNAKLIGTLKTLRDLGNTVIVVEHDRETMESADWLVDIGPGAGEHGGKIVAQGTPKKVRESKRSITGRYLRGEDDILIPAKRREGNGHAIRVVGAKENNLRDLTVEFPLGKFVTVTGVSGSGKSSLVDQILSKKLAQHFHRAQEQPGAHESIEGLEHLNKVITIDQSPIGRTPRSNPATYTGVFTNIRDLFAATNEAKMRGYSAGRFSFNVKGGRCEHCRGDGVIKIEMHFLPDVYVPCEECHGKRYNKEALEIHYKGKTIADVLEMTIEKALKFFEHIPVIKQKLGTLHDVGLGYMRLGQPATTLSGGEAQRIKLATELSRRATGQTLYILDEPTTGLHFEDIKRLLAVLDRLVDMGNTVLVIEHNLDVIKTADHIIDLGPDGGGAGGQVVAEGTPEAVAKTKRSYTGTYLVGELKRSKKAPPKKYTSHPVTA